MGSSGEEREETRPWLLFKPECFKGEVSHTGLDEMPIKQNKGKTGSKNDNNASNSSSTKGSGAKGTGSVVTLDDVASSLTTTPAPGEGLVVFRWQGHENVILLRFPSNAVQKASMARLSLFLEDKEHSGTVLEHLPTGRVGGALAYTGHNFRASDAARFFEAVNAAGFNLSDAENQLRLALESQRIVVTVKGGGYIAPSKFGVIAVARGFEREEAKETLLHEAMHGLFYTAGDFERACWAFWQSSLKDDDRDTWREFLEGVGYDSSNEELTVNEFQAYMSTETKLFAPSGGGRVWGVHLSSRAATFSSLHGLFVRLYEGPQVKVHARAQAETSLPGYIPVMIFGCNRVCRPLVDRSFVSYIVASVRAVRPLMSSAASSATPASSQFNHVRFNHTYMPTLIINLIKFSPPKALQHALQLSAWGVDAALTREQ
eukprot:1190010-Prorocentrum_minimum.AAC.4